MSEVPIVFDNIVFNLQRAGGVSRVWSKIITSFNDSKNVSFIERYGAEVNIYRSNMSLSPILRDHFLPIHLSRYLNFSHKFYNDKFIFHSSYFRVNSSLGCVNVTTVHDLIYEKFGRGLGALIHLRQKAFALEKSDCIVCVSENTRKDLLEHYPFCADKKVVVIPNGVGKFNLSGVSSNVIDGNSVANYESYFLYVGHRGSCKGFNLIYDVLDMLDDSLKCIVVGEPFTQSEFAEIQARNHTQNIINVGKVSDSHLNILYQNASFFFFPSLYEGFGIPPLEAMEAGCPVLASNRSSIPEVVGDAGVLFDPLDLETLNNGLSRLMRADVKDKLIVLGKERVNSFSWELVVKRYEALYSELI